MAYRVEKWDRGDPPKASELTRLMRAERYDVFAWTDSPGTVYGRHDHADDQSHWVISGRLEVTVEGVGVILLGPGDRDFMLAGTQHSARVVGDEAVHYLIGTKK
jgi:quercetin dioxygenase-like cupin family protein